MADVVAGYLDEQGLGRPLDRVELHGKLDGRSSSKRTLLCRTQNALYLVSASSRREGRHVDVLAQAPVTYRTGRVTDYLDVGGLSFRIPTGRGAEARAMLQLARLHQRADERSVESLHLVAGALATTPGEVERLAIATWLEQAEPLLAWLPTDSRVPIRSAVLEESEGAAWFLLTDRRACLLAWSPVGDVKVEPVERGRFEVVEKSRECVLRAANTEWCIHTSDRIRYAELERAVASVGDARSLHCARVEWALSPQESLPKRCEELLSRLLESDDSDIALEARIALALLKRLSGQTADIRGLAETLGTTTTNDELCARVWSAWKLPEEAGRALLAQMDESTRLAPWALSLHRELHRASRHKGKKSRVGMAQDALSDAQLAEHLLDSGEKEEAKRLLDQRIGSLPSEEFTELLPAPDADLTTGGGGQTVHIQLYELLARAHDDSAAASDAIAELARLQPLVPERLERLAAVAPEPLASRASDALACLAPGGLDRIDRAAPQEVLPLPRHLVEGVLPHPLARAGSAFVGRLQSLLAQVEVPNVGVLRDYCERLSARDTEAARALTSASLALGVSGTEGYVSRGKKSIGTRAYEGKPPFVLVGGRHLDDDPAFRLSAQELRFAIGAEVAHLRFEHTRVTSSELWAGALDAGKQSLDLALGVLPILRGIGMAGRLGSLASKLQMNDVQRILSGARSVDRLRAAYAGEKVPVDEPELDASVITAPNEALIAAHRVMQLTADRAGLVLCGDLNSALRAMFLVRPDFRAELVGIERNGLADVLGRRTEDGSMTYQNLAVRIAALISFYLSEDYTRLRGALTGRTEG